jgi:hypothetical protein
MNQKLFNKISMLTLICAWVAVTPPAHAEEEKISDPSTHFAIGFDIDSYSNNFGGGLNLSSPYFFDNISHVQLTADMAYVQGVKTGETTTTWAPYGLFKLGYFSGRFIEGTSIRIYGGGGLVILAPPSSLSSSGVNFGGYGLTGVEILVNKKRTKGLFLEFGAMGTGAFADKMVSSPIYANGFTVSWGYKYYL